MREISRIRQMEDPSQNDLSPQALTMVLSRLLDALTDLSEVFTVLGMSSVHYDKHVLIAIDRATTKYNT